MSKQLKVKLLNALRAMARANHYRAPTPSRLKRRHSALLYYAGRR